MLYSWPQTNKSEPEAPGFTRQLPYLWPFIPVSVSVFRILIHSCAPCFSVRWWVFPSAIDSMIFYDDKKWYRPRNFLCRYLGRYLRKLRIETRLRAPETPIMKYENSHTKRPYSLPLLTHYLSPCLCRIHMTPPLVSCHATTGTSLKSYCERAFHCST